jgi:hypothetical protein
VGYRYRKKSRVASGITTQVRSTTKRATKTAFWMMSGSESRNGPVRIEMMIETGRAAIQVTMAWRAFVGGLRTLCPGA